LGETDLAALNTYFAQSDEPVVLLLHTLSEDEQMGVLGAQGAQTPQALEFLAEARHRGLDDFLANPQNLIMLWAVAKGGSWPASRGERRINGFVKCWPAIARQRRMTQKM